jgi:hypothetical protein
MKGARSIDARSEVTADFASLMVPAPALATREVRT